MTTNKLVAALQQIRALVDEALGQTARARSSKPSKSKARALKSEAHAEAISFDMNLLAFMKKFASKLSGPKKFTLLLAWLTKGNLSAQIPYQDIDAKWNKMKTILGSSNPAHGNRAKAWGWVDSEKGRWKLTSTWKEALDR